jgi:hypothetical protein
MHNALEQYYRIDSERERNKMGKTTRPQPKTQPALKTEDARSARAGAPRLIPGFWFRRDPSRNEHFIVKDGLLCFDGNLAELIPYDPATEAGLLSEFADIGALLATDEPVEHAIRRFAEKYGLLGYFRFHDPPKNWPLNKPFIEGEPLEWVEAHARAVHASLRLRALVDAGGTYEARKYLDAIWNGPHFGHRGSARPLSFWSAYRDRNMVSQFALQIICHLISSNIDGLRWTLNDWPGTLRLSLNYGALLEFIYWQLAQRVTREGHVKICRNCCKVFLTENTRAEFCLPQPGATFSRCRSAFNNRMHQQRTKAGDGRRREKKRRA